MLVSRFLGVRRPAGLRIFTFVTQSLRSCSSRTPSQDATLGLRFGRPVLSLRLPDGLQCRLTLTPMLTTVGDVLRDITARGGGVSGVSILNTEGQRISSASVMETVIDKDFLLVINDVTHHVSALGQGGSHEHVLGPDDMRFLVQLLHSALTEPDQQLIHHRHLTLRRDQLQGELLPLEAVRLQLAKEAESRATALGWAGLAYLSLQGGFLAYLTWYVFAWDVMEPVTYFITYGTSMIFFCYYVLTKQDFLCPGASDRQFLHFFYRKAKTHNFDVAHYNTLKEELAQVESALRRLRGVIAHSQRA